MLNSLGDAGDTGNTENDRQQLFYACNDR